MSANVCLDKKSSIKSKIDYPDIDAMVHEAAKKLVPVWPLKTFIACNPLQGFEHEHFEEAMKQRYVQSVSCPQEEAVNREMVKWLSTFLDTGQAGISAPFRERGFYAYFCILSPNDKHLHQGRSDFKAVLNHLPACPKEAIFHYLQILQIPVSAYTDFIEQNLNYLAGWSGYIKWLSLWDHTQDFIKRYPISLVEYMAVRLIITQLLWPTISLEKNTIILEMPELEQLKEDEQNYAYDLLNSLQKGLTNLSTKNVLPEVQMVFCIDVRSEPFRRQIEAIGPYETLGFAGFFGLPIRVYDEDKHHFSDCCPVLLKPRFSIHQIFQGSNAQKQSRQKLRSLLRSFLSAYQQLKYNYATPFQLADVMGPWSGLWMVFKNFFPEKLGIFLNKCLEKWILSDKLELGIDAIPRKEQVEYAEVILKLMGLTKNFAKLVVFCGHRSTTTNNPYASALDCGACGGNEGVDNPKLLAQILNQPWLREQLNLKGLVIPDDTYFMAAVHDTSTDECHLSHHSMKPHFNLFLQLKNDLKIVQQKNLIYRSGFFNDSWEKMRKKSLNWAEVRPEWGLARNAAFIVGPRRLTESLDCDGRCFLHSYDWQIDDRGQLLETILTAPMVVAQWINHQYLFSTLDNVLYGSGSKITHNVVGKIGVMQGNGSDLMHGLALQSVNGADDKAFHQPMRLLTVVYAPRQRVMEIILKNDVLQKLFFNEWVHLVVIEPIEHQFYRLEQKQWKQL